MSDFAMRKDLKKFQSIYTYKRRWNVALIVWNNIRKSVSIHLYLQEALEFESKTDAADKS